MDKKRRTFIKQGGLAALGFGMLGLNACSNNDAGNGPAETGEQSNTKAAPKTEPEAPKGLFQISLAQWSLHRAFRSEALDPIDFAATAKNDFGVDAIEYVNQFFLKRGRDKPFLKELKKRADDNGVKSLLIMVDQMGPLAHPDNDIRQKAIQLHYQWVEAAYLLGCHSVRVNLEGEGTPEDMGHAGLDGLATLADFAKDFNINIIVENHGGNSSNARWLTDVIGRVNMANCGTLPDFGNFCIQKKNDVCVQEYDKYKGMKEMLPYAKAVSAKAFDFDAEGNETTIDFKRMMQMVKDAGYSGYVGIEYEGNTLSEAEGIKATKKLLERVIGELT